MTTTAAPLTDGADTAPAAGEGRSASERGTTAIAPVVFERLARAAAAEIEGVVGEVQTGFSRLLPWTSGSPAEASAQVDEDSIVLDLTLNVAYPQPVRLVAEQVRRHVAERVQGCTGRTVREVNITVAELVNQSRHRRRALQ